MLNRALRIAGLILVAAAIGWFFPLFHVVPRGELRSNLKPEVFNAASFAKQFWTDQLLPAVDGAHDAKSTLNAIRDNPQKAREEFGKTAGLGRSTLYLLRGKGTVVAVDAKSLGVDLSDDGSIEVVIATGLLFGNTLRDCTGQVRGEDLANSQQFNEVSTELNRIAETQVITPLKESAKVGDVIEFAGCAEVTNVPRDISPIKLIPIVVTKP
jgi:predicted lipoprotein